MKLTAPEAFVTLLALTALKTDVETRPTNRAHNTTLRHIVATQEKLVQDYPPLADMCDNVGKD